jgi:hypothetical protein
VVDTIVRFETTHGVGEVVGKGPGSSTEGDEVRENDTQEIMVNKGTVAKRSNIMPLEVVRVVIEVDEAHPQGGDASNRNVKTDGAILKYQIKRFDSNNDHHLESLRKTGDRDKICKADN